MCTSSMQAVSAAKSSRKCLGFVNTVLFSCKTMSMQLIFHALNRRECLCGR